MLLSLGRVAYITDRHAENGQSQPVRSVEDTLNSSTEPR